MSIENNDNNNNKGFITQAELKNFIFIGGIVLTGVIYVLNMQTELSLLKNEIQHMKELIKELHDHQIGARTKISAVHPEHKSNDNNFDLVGNLHDIEVNIVDGVIDVMKITNAVANRRNQNNSENNEELPTEIDEIVLYDNRKRYFNSETIVDDEIDG